MLSQPINDFIHFSGSKAFALEDWPLWRSLSVRNDAKVRLSFLDYYKAIPFEKLLFKSLQILKWFNENFINFFGI